MLFDTYLITRENLADVKEEWLRENGHTSDRINCITGLDMQDGKAILLSRENWRRLEFFMSLLSEADIKIGKKKIEEVLKWEH